MKNENEITENEITENEKLAVFYGIMSGVHNYTPLPLASDKAKAEADAYENARLAFSYAARVLDARTAAEAEPEETPEQRLARMRAYRAACNAREAAGIAKAASLEIGQIVRCEDGWWILESRGVRTTWGESGDGFHHVDTQTVTVSKCRANGQRLKSRQYVTADASAFGNAMI